MMTDLCADLACCPPCALSRSRSARVSPPTPRVPTCRKSRRDKRSHSGFCFFPQMVSMVTILTELLQMATGNGAHRRDSLFHPNTLPKRHVSSDVGGSRQRIGVVPCCVGVDLTVDF